MDFDILLAGGGLAGGLIALRLAQLRPDLAVGIVEAGPTIGGNHTWSFFSSDVGSAAEAWLAPLVERRWHGYEVAFPGHARRFDATYQSVTSARLAAAVRAALPQGAIITDAPVAEVHPTHVALADGRCVAARTVIDTRGADPAAALELAWQKFVGLEVETVAPHGLAHPIIMDATVEQVDGYRFVYVLPFGPTRLLIEDTYYSDRAQLDVATITERIHAYAARRGWAVARVERTEQGVLPIALGGDMARLWAGADVPKAGMRAALFHPLTGYSLPDAVKAAEAVAALPRHDPASVGAALQSLSRRLWRERGFHRLLVRLLFRAARPTERYRVIERFYRLDAALIRRLYAGTSTFADKAAILIGRPPVPLGRAIAVTMGAR